MLFFVLPLSLATSALFFYLNTQPYLLYGIVAWGQAAKTYKTKFLFFKSAPSASCSLVTTIVPYFVSSSFLPLDQLSVKSVTILMHDISKINVLDTFFYSEYFQKKMIILIYPTY